MAKNLREKIPADDVLMIQDVNKDAVKKFVDELSGFNVIAAENARDIAERSVRSYYPIRVHLHPMMIQNCSIHD